MNKVISGLHSSNQFGILSYSRLVTSSIYVRAEREQFFSLDKFLWFKLLSVMLLTTYVMHNMILYATLFINIMFVSSLFKMCTGTLTDHTFSKIIKVCFLYECCNNIHRCMI